MAVLPSLSFDPVLFFSPGLLGVAFSARVVLRTRNHVQHLPEPGERVALVSRKRAGSSRGKEPSQEGAEERGRETKPSPKSTVGNCSVKKGGRSKVVER